MDWREAAHREVRSLKPHFVEKYGWDPQVTETDDAIDVVFTLRGKNLGDRVYALRLRYLPDWEDAGRREAFVDPDNPTVEGLEHWPPANTVRGVNPQHAPRCICLRGVFGYHSVLHSNERSNGATLLNFLLELQGVIAE